MAAAQSLARQGYETHIIEKNARLGGQALNLHTTSQGESVPEKLTELIREVESEENIIVHLNTTLSGVDGFVGNFESTLTTDGKEEPLRPRRGRHGHRRIRTETGRIRLRR